MKKILAFSFLLTTLMSCGGSQLVIRNIDDTARKLQTKNGHFEITEYTDEVKYGYTMDYPINLGFDNERNNPRNVDYFFKALAGPNGEAIQWKKIDTCCPFASKKSNTGAGTLEIYEIRYGDQTLLFYINLYERSKIVCPKGLTIKKD
ncbi:MAG: hypothetical protein RL607_465 [Bacteroidota bacterium]|jgi:hypothetical protein